MKKEVIVFLVLLSLVAKAGQFDLLQQGMKSIPKTYGLTPPKEKKSFIPKNVIGYPSGISNVISRMGLNGEKLATFNATKDDIVIDSVLVIEHDTTIYGNIVLVNNAQLIVRNCSFFFKGNLYALQNSSFSVDNTDFVMLQDFIYQFTLMTTDSAKIEINNTCFNSANLPISVTVVDKSYFLMDSVDMDGGFITFCTFGTGSVIDIRNSNRVGEFVILGDSSQLHISHSDTVLIWLGFPRGSSGELHGSFNMGDWVEKFTYPDTTCRGLTYSVEIDSLYGLILATMAMDSTDITIYDANLQSCGNIFELTMLDTISGLVDESHYDNWIAPLPERNLHLINSSVRAWNLYFFGGGGSNITLKGSIFGECIASTIDSSKTFLMNTTCDGYGGHIGAAGSSFLISFFTSLYTDALMEDHSISMLFLTNFMWGHLIVRDMAISVLYNTILANPIQVYDSATVLVTGLYPPSPAYIEDTLSIRGSATIVKALYSPFEFEGYKLEYAPIKDTSQFFPLTGVITDTVNNRELCEFITCGLDVGTYLIRLFYFFSAFGSYDTLTFDNTIYLTYKPAVEEGKSYLEPSLSIYSVLSGANVQYAVPQTSEVELSLYNICGQKVAMLEKGIKKAGRYEIKIDSKDFLVGLYFCQLQIGETFRQTKKLLLLR
ncbi:MAG: hypothetical protein HY769_03675 [Candidatus Stahlbacteria bacterium]|nr:hypothetical protein [Candidatus Stahlbacteria bacterium]